MVIRNAAENDMDVLEALYASARRFMAEHGNPNQWINGYPGRDILLEDIKNRNLYLCVDENGEQPVSEKDGIVGVFCYFDGPEPDYAYIDGNWKDNSSYGVIHRITAKTGTKGVASFCVDWCMERTPHLRMDTHQDNVPMQRFLQKKGFQYCGLIYVRDGGERMGFELTDKEITYA